MPKVTVTCDRCKKDIDGLRIPDAGTSGFYEGSYWQQYMNPDEKILCDACMQDTPRYKQDYHRQNT